VALPPTSLGFAPEEREAEFDREPQNYETEHCGECRDEDVQNCREEELVVSVPDCPARK
jgi:hypothetical protein